MRKLRFLVLVGMILVAADTRPVPHPANFAPIGAMALWEGLVSLISERRFLTLEPALALSK
jgi:hypothetical protein